MRGFSDKTVVITGASSGIGRATAEAFAREGARLVLAARSADALARVAAVCEALGGKVIAVPTDVTDADAVERLVGRALSFSGRIDIWLSNVGVGAVGPFEKVPMEVHAKVVQTNLIGHMNDAHAVLPVFLQQKRGIFISMGSLGAFTAAPYAAAYSAGKFGLRGFTSALRAEMARHRHIHICAVYPGFVDAPGVPHAANYTGRRLSVPAPLIDAHRVAQAVLDLARRPRDSVTIGATAHVLRRGHVLVPQLALNLLAWRTRRALLRAAPADHTSGNVLRPPEERAGIDGGLRSGQGVPVAAIAIGGVVAMIALKRLLSRQGRRIHGNEETLRDLPDPEKM